MPGGYQLPYAQIQPGPGCTVVHSSDTDEDASSKAFGNGLASSCEIVPVPNKTVVANRVLTRIFFKVKTLSPYGVDVERRGKTRVASDWFWPGAGDARGGASWRTHVKNE